MGSAIAFMFISAICFRVLSCTVGVGRDGAGKFCEVDLLVPLGTVERVALVVTPGLLEEFFFWAEQLVSYEYAKNSGDSHHPSNFLSSACLSHHPRAPLNPCSHRFLSSWR